MRQSVAVGSLLFVILSRLQAAKNLSIALPGKFLLNYMKEPVGGSPEVERASLPANLLSGQGRPLHHIPDIFIFIMTFKS